MAKFPFLLWRCFSPHEELISFQAFEVTLLLPLVTKQDTEVLPRDTAQEPRRVSFGAASEELPELPRPLILYLWEFI